MLLLSMLTPMAALLAARFAAPPTVARCPYVAMAAPPEAWAVRRMKDGTNSVGAKDVSFRPIDLDASVPRSEAAPGIGLGLEELGSDGNGVGLVLVDSVVPDSNAAKASEAILPGDALISVRAASGGASVSLEGLTYDSTIDILTSIDPSIGALVFTVRRLVVQPKVAVTLRFPDQDRADESITMLPGQPLRQTFLSSGIKLNDPLALRFDSGGPGDCGGEGCCCTCAIEVETGLDLLNEQKTQEKQMLRKHPSWRLGCRARVSEGLEQDATLVVRVSPRTWEACEPDLVPEECVAQ